MAQQQPQQQFSVRLEQPSKFNGDMDQDVVESWVFQVENYFALSGMTDENVKARYSTMLLDKSAAIWLRNQNYTLATLQWTNLKQDIKSYFQPADFHRRARDSLATCNQNSTVSKYIDAMKRHAQRVAGITDDEMLDRFIRGLKPAIQREVLKDNPSTFSDACMLAERIGRLDTYLTHSTRNNSQTNNGVVPMELGSVQVNAGTASRQQRDYTSDRQGTNRPTCWYCGKRGHLSKDCFARKKDQGQGQNNYSSNKRGRGGRKYGNGRGSAHVAAGQSEDEQKN